MGMRGGFPYQLNLHRSQGVGLVDKVAEGALQGQCFGGEGAGGLNAAGVFLAQSPDPGGGQRLFLAPMRFTSLTQVLESRSVRARSLLLGFSMPYSTRNQSSNVRWVCCWREVILITS